jgi:hypothetical protein
MSTLTFDTLKFANRLKTAGVPAIQAEAEAEALSEVLETNLGELVTKSDLREMETGLRHEIKEVETSLRHEISDLRKDIDTRFEKTDSAFRQEMTNLKFELLKWMIGLLIAQTGLLIGLLKFFPLNS